MSPRVKAVPLVLLALAILLDPARAQDVPTGPFTVTTIPSQDPNRLPSSGPFTVPFYVINTTDTLRAGDFTCGTTGPVTCGTVTPASSNVAPHDSVSVSLTYSTTASTGAAVITLTATPEIGLPSSGSRTTNVANAGKAVPTFLNANQDNLDRGLCLTVGAGDAAGVSCGDLFVVQGMPTFRSLGRDRTLSLYYNSAPSNSLTLIAGTVAEPNTIAMPTSIRVVVTVTVPSGQQFKDSTTYAPPAINPVCTGSPCAPYSDPQQFVVGRGLTGMATGYYPATLTVRNIYPVVTLDSTISGFIIVVNRKSSIWGRGWSLLGLESFTIDPSDTTRGFWWGGDNSIRVYRKPTGQPNSLVFYGAAGDAPDSLVRFDTLGVKWYRRGLRHGAAVLVDETGTHRVTRNRAGQATVFTYGLVGGKSRLLTITVPPKRATPLTYNLTWNATTGRLDSIVDPAGRRMVLTIGTDTLVSKILIRALGDPNTYETRFTYFGNRMVTRAVVRPDTFPGHLATTSYAYASNARLTSVTIPYDTLSSGRTAVTTFTPWDQKGLTVLVLADTAGLPTRVDGPITGTGDAADILVERFGGAKRIIGLGLDDTTTISRTDATNPGLITKVAYPNRRTITMTWNTRANLAMIRDSTKKCPGTPCDSLPTKVTTYTYGDQTNAPDSPTKVEDALLRHSDFTYDSLGLTTLATDTRGHRTKFYNRTLSSDTLRGLVDSVAELNVTTWIEASQTEVLDTLATRFHYDSTTGNLLWLKSPLGVITSYKLDAAGNVTDVVDPMRTRTVFAGYDLWNRAGEIDHPATKYTVYPPFNPLADCLADQIVCTDVLPDGGGTQVERYFLNVVGLDSTSDARGVKRRFASDALGRIWRETDELGNSRRVFYNVFGAADSTRSRSNITVKYLYDSLGRLNTRFWPTVSDPFNHPADSVLSDSIRYTYDVMGNVLTAQSRLGTITRTYYGDNSIRTRTTALGGLDSLKYTYDATGARTRVVHWAPKNSTRDSVLYTYNGAGDLASIKVYHTGASPVLQTFSFLWDSLGRRRQVTYLTGGPTVVFAYDAGGTVRRILGTGTGRFDFSLRDSLVDPAGNIGVEKATCHLLSGDTFAPGSLCGGVGPQTITSTFNRLGEVLKQVFSGQDSRTDSMKYDASGNLTFRRRSTDLPTDRLWSILANSNRLASEAFLGETFGFTLDGSRRYASQSINFTEKYWYDGLGRTSGVAVTGPDAHLGPNQCKYDPDGQMYTPCDDDAPQLAFDGPNVVTAFSDEWRFVDGPGLDDPLVGLARLSSGSRRLYFITDGNGRQLMVTDSAGKLRIDDQPAPGYPQGDWRYGGATSAANTFSSDRINPPNLPTVALFRNRVYDQRSGRWTQEDPLGPAGGLNQYRYNGNNPVGFSDPFGLQGCDQSKGGNPFTCLQEILTPWKKPLEIGGTIAILPLGFPGLLEEGVVGSLGLAAARSSVPTATNTALRNTIQALFRVGDKIPGGTAGAIRAEAMTGEATGGVFHLQKGIERIANLERILRREILNPVDRATAERLLTDLKEAVDFALKQIAQ